MTATNSQDHIPEGHIINAYEPRYIFSSLSPLSLLPPLSQSMVSCCTPEDHYWSGVGTLFPLQEEICGQEVGESHLWNQISWSTEWPFCMYLRGKRCMDAATLYYII